MPLNKETKPSRLRIFLIQSINCMENVAIDMKIKMKENTYKKLITFITDNASSNNQYI